jgi:hypothetical protein
VCTQPLACLPACLPACRCQGPGGIAAVADLGGSIITGIDGNPLAVLARQLGLPLHDIQTADVRLYLQDGSQLDAALDAQARPVGWLAGTVLYCIVLYCIVLYCIAAHVQDHQWRRGVSVTQLCVTQGC